MVDKLNWKGDAKKSGIQMGDIISNFKIENPDRPNKSIVYPFALIFLFYFLDLIIIEIKIYEKILVISFF